MSVVLIPLATLVDYEYLESTYGDKDVFICDTYVQEAENWEEIEGGYKKGRYINIDHHAPGERMSKFVTSTCLACDYVKKHGVVGKDSIVLINHTDCDSILSSQIMIGFLEPETRYAEASIDSDHTGRENYLADALQSCAYFQNIEKSLECLNSVLSKRKMPQDCYFQYKKRLNERQSLASSVQKGEFKQEGALHYISREKKVDTALLPALIPDSIIIGVFSPQGNGNISVSLRLGLNPPPGYHLNQQGFPDGFCGRWNAGSNTRRVGMSSGGLNPMLGDCFNSIWGTKF